MAVADRLSFSKAAESLHLTQPALSRQIRDLEGELGCRLFVRNPTGIRLTPDGEFLRQRASALLREADDLAREMQVRGKSETRRVRIAHFGTFLEIYLVPFVHRLHQRFPGWQVDLVELDPANALRQVTRGEIDAAATGRPAAERLSGLKSRVIWTEQPLIVVPANHGLAKRRRIRLRDLVGASVLIWDEDQFPGFGEPFMAACRAAGREPIVAGTVESVASVFTRVARDGVVGYVGRLASQIPAPGVAFVPLVPGELEMPTLLVWRPDSPAAAVVNQLAAMLAAEVPASAGGAVEPGRAEA